MARSFASQRRHLAVLAVLAAVCGALLCGTPVLAQERILAFHSDIRIGADASMDVTETIRVRAEGLNIRRGIYREFPTRYRDRFGNAFKVDFDVISVTRDGRPEAYNTVRRANGVRVDFGTDEFLAVPREYEYALHYRTTRQIGFFPDHDELYWNVTGNGWSFVIAQASATVRLPEPVPAAALALEGYTGGFGASGQDYTTRIGNGEATIRTTAALQPNEGLTLVLSFPKGLLPEPTPAERAQYLLKDNRGLLLALLTLAAVLAYLGSAWRRVGRDPAAGVIFPHYEPPAGFSPAAARYLLRLGNDSKVFTAALINLAVQGYVHISQQGRKYLLERRASTQPLAADEQRLFAALMAEQETLELDNTNHAAISRARSAHAAVLKQQCHGTYFLNNTRYLLPSLLGTGAMFMMVLVMNALVPLAVGVFILAGILHALFGYLLKAPTAAGRQVLDQLAGFKLYLDVAEKDEMNLRNPPALTPELFEKYLPYAIALGVEQAWAERFARALAGMQQGRSNSYYPLWYSGQFNVAHLGQFTNAVSSSLASAISSAATPPGSASGAGGGGFSGGGGGGGGGGGR